MIRLNKISDKSYELTGHLIFLILILFAVYFYKERVLYVDSSYALFKIIYYKTLVSEAGRYSATLPQILPLAGIGMHLPLKWVVLLYSVSFVILYYLIFLIILYILKNPKIALSLPVILTISIKYSYYWIATETHQSLAYIVLFIAFLYYFKNNVLKRTELLKFVIGGSCILCVAFFCHPTVFFSGLFLSGFYIIDFKYYKKLFIYIFPVLLAVLTILKLKLISSGSYEDRFISCFFDSISAHFHFKQSYGYVFFIKNWKQLYLLVILIGIITAGYYIKKRDFIKLSYYIISCLAYFTIILLTFRDGDSDHVMEKNFMPLNIFIVLPFILDFHIKTKYFPLLLCAFVITIYIININKIYQARSFFDQRFEYINKLISETENIPANKYIVEKKNIDFNKVGVPWSFANETLIYSSMRSNKNSKTFFIVDDIKNIDYDINDRNLYLCTPFWPRWNISSLDTFYFYLNEHGYFPVVGLHY
jgi:hypothetical protein